MQARERSWESYAVETERQRERERERERILSATNQHGSTYNKSFLTVCYIGNLY